MILRPLIDRSFLAISKTSQEVFNVPEKTPNAKLFQSCGAELWKFKNYYLRANADDLRDYIGQNPKLSNRWLDVQVENHHQILVTDIKCYQNLREVEK